MGQKLVLNSFEPHIHFVGSVCVQTLLMLSFWQPHKAFYSFSIGANAARSRLIPTPGKAMSIWRFSFSPVTFTTVPVPQTLCFALSPGTQVSFSAPTAPVGVYVVLNSRLRFPVPACFLDQ